MPVRPAIATIETTSGDFEVHSVSGTLTNEDITNLINSGLDRTFITIGLTFIILLLTFGAFVASVVPLVLAITALFGAFGILGIFSQLVRRRARTRPSWWCSSASPSRSTTRCS